MTPEPLLYTLAFLGAWNLMNALLRLYWHEPPAARYWWSILAGAWAAAILFTTPGAV